MGVHMGSHGVTWVAHYRTLPLLSGLHHSMQRGKYDYLYWCYLFVLSTRMTSVPDTALAFVLWMTAKNSLWAEVVSRENLTSREYGLAALSVAERQIDVVRFVELVRISIYTHDITWAICLATSEMAYCSVHCGLATMASQVLSDCHLTHYPSSSLSLDPGLLPDPETVLALVQSQVEVQHWDYTVGVLKSVQGTEVTVCRVWCSDKERRCVSLTTVPLGSTHTNVCPIPLFSHCPTFTQESCLSASGHLSYDKDTGFTPFVPSLSLTHTGEHKPAACLSVDDNHLLSPRKPSM